MTDAARLQSRRLHEHIGTDSSFRETPSNGSILHGIEVTLRQRQHPPHHAPGDPGG